jgi:hypothetical protein
MDVGEYLRRNGVLLQVPDHGCKKGQLRNNGIGDDQGVL